MYYVTMKIIHTLSFSYFVFFVFLSLKGARMLTLEKLPSKELYSILITKFTNKRSSNVYFEKIFPNINSIGEKFTYYHA